jgi:hypothetical protein
VRRLPWTPPPSDVWFLVLSAVSDQFLEESKAWAENCRRYPFLCLGPWPPELSSTISSWAQWVPMSQHRLDPETMNQEKASFNPGLGRYLLQLIVELDSTCQFLCTSPRKSRICKLTNLIHILSTTSDFTDRHAVEIRRHQFLTAMSSYCRIVWDTEVHDIFRSCQMLVKTPSRGLQNP